MHPWERKASFLYPVWRFWLTMYRPIVRQRLDKHFPAETDSWQAARCQVMPTIIRDNSRRPLIGRGQTRGCITVTDSDSRVVD
jgi:hypothetical protein